jgi:hypothetical protein
MTNGYDTTINDEGPVCFLFSYDTIYLLSTKFLDITLTADRCRRHVTTLRVVRRQRRGTTNDKGYEVTGMANAKIMRYNGYEVTGMTNAKSMRSDEQNGYKCRVLGPLVGFLFCFYMILSTLTTLY